MLLQFVELQLLTVMVADNIKVRAKTVVEVKTEVKVSHKFTVKDINFEDIMVNNIRVEGTELKDKQAEDTQVSHNLVQANCKQLIPHKVDLLEFH